MFYLRVFYELAIPGFIVDVEAGSKIVDANWAAINALDTMPSKIIGVAFAELFVVNSPDSCLDYDQLPSIGSEFTCHFMESGSQSRLYRHRHLVENAFARLKHFRGLATRYDKLKRNYQSGVAMACGFLWLPM
ncbi:DDE family transposase [Marinobacter sp. LV10MA510-1]|nr:DDE family transposase [Marinobacter sp. LV10MA510-1]